MRFVLPCVPGCPARLHRDSTGRIDDADRDHLLTHTEDERQAWAREVAGPRFREEALARLPAPALNRAQRRARR